MQALLSEHAAGVPALGHAVGPERDQIAHDEQAFAIVVLTVGDHAQQWAADADLLGLARRRAHDHGRRVTGAGHTEQVAAVGGSQRRERRRAELLRRRLGPDRVVDDGEYAAGGFLVAAHDTHGLTRQARQRRRRWTVPGDVADGQEGDLAVLPGVVEIAADLGALAG